MQTFSKVFFIVALVFFTRLLSSCDNQKYEEQKIFYDIDSLTVQNLNNSGEHLQMSFNDEMDRGAVAFRLNLLSKDLLRSGYQYTKKNAPDGVLGLTAALARSPVLPELIANQTIKKITIVTLTDISEAIKSGADVSDKFLLGSDWDLYSEIHTIFDKPLSSYTTVRNSLNLMLKETVKNSEAQFRFTVELSDHNVFSVETNRIKINAL